MVRSVLFALSKPTSLLCPTVTPSPTSPIKPSRPTKLTRMQSRIRTVQAPTSLAFLTGNLKSERSSDRERARYYRMQEEEAAVLAAAAAGDYDSDD